MGNSINAQGITIQTLAEIIADIVDGTVDVPGLKQIYGPDINVDSNSPDGQMVSIFALAKKDILDLIVQDYASKDPDQAVGVALDALAQLCGITRKGGSYTITDIAVTVDRDINLAGLDDTASIPFTVQDATGNKFYLEESAALTTGVNTLSFRAAQIGVVQILPNTLTIPVTIVLGVTAVNNPSSPTQDGENQETDSEFRIRRQKSVSAPSQGYLQSLFGGLNDIDGLTGAVVFENNTGSTSGDGIPAHSIWVIVDGGSDDDVAEAIYKYRNAGAGMKGAEEVDITQVDGSIFTVKFDRATDENLHLKFHLDAINGGSIDPDQIKDGLVANWKFNINTSADITTLSGLIREINPNVVVSFEAGMGVSNNGSDYENIVSPSTKAKKFVLLAANIDIDT